MKGERRRSGGRQRNDKKRERRTGGDRPPTGAVFVRKTPKGNASLPLIECEKN